MPNFDEMSQSTAEIKLLLVSENGWPPYWNSTSGFNFDVRVVIGMSFCICLPNFIVIRLWTIGDGVMTSYRFFNMAAMKSEMYFPVEI